MGARLLIVDDDLERGRAYVRIGRSVGFEEVRHVAEGLEAMRLLEAEAFEGVVLDIHLPKPGPDGVDIWRWLSEHRPGKMAILVTGHPFQRRELLARAQGARVHRGVTVKPLKAELRQMLDGPDVCVGNVRWVKERRQIWIDSGDEAVPDTRVDLTPSENGLFGALVARPRRSTTRAELRTALWVPTPGARTRSRPISRGFARSSRARTSTCARSAGGSCA